MLRVAGARDRPAPRNPNSRRHTMDRLIALLEQAAADHAQLVFPELAFTTFFPRWLFDSTQELDTYFERALPARHPGPSSTTAASSPNIALNIGYAELTETGERFNTSILVNPDGTLLGKYRKIHLPGSVEPRPAPASSSWKSATSNTATSASPPSAPRSSPAASSAC